jgi:voltage-gated potassium channel
MHKVFVGDAADRRVLERAGILTARSVLLTTNDDAMNVYLAVYCRRLNANLRIVSRITMSGISKRFTAQGRISC